MVDAYHPNQDNLSSVQETALKRISSSFSSSPKQCQEDLIVNSFSQLHSIRREMGQCEGGRMVVPPDGEADNDDCSLDNLMRSGRILENPLEELSTLQAR